VIQSAIEMFAQEFAGVIERFLKLKHWKDAERIVVGGGFSNSRVGELAIDRASIILKAEKIKTEISIIRNDPDEAALIGAIHLAPAWMFKAHNAILAVDIGGRARCASSRKRPRLFAIPSDARTRLQPASPPNRSTANPASLDYGSSRSARQGVATFI